MTNPGPAPDRWEELRGLVASPGAPGLAPDRVSDAWMLLGAYDRAEGADQVTGEPVAFEDAVVVVGPWAVSALVSARTWDTRRDEAVALVGTHLSEIVASQRFPA